MTDLDPLTPSAQPRPRARRSVLVSRIRALVALTIAWNLIEAVVALAAGAVAGSAALLGFGLDSVVEVSSAAAVAWQLAGRDPAARERVALRVIGASFLALAALVTVQAVRALLVGDAAQESRVGISLAAASLLVMPVAAWLQRRAGRELGSAAAVADSRQTMLCAFMSAALLLGLVTNASLGWWWADPVAALVIAGLALREGVQALRGDACCAPPLSLLAPGAARPHDPREDRTSAPGCACGTACACC